MVALMADPPQTVLSTGRVSVEAEVETAEAKEEEVVVVAADEAPVFVSAGLERLL